MPSKTLLKTRIALHEIRHKLGISPASNTGPDPDREGTRAAAERGWSADDVREAVAAHPFWWHTIDLPYGIRTPGRIAPVVHKWVAQAIPERLDGRSVLDIGAWDGYYSFLAERRGASVTAIEAPFNQRGVAGFHTIRKILGSNAEHLVHDLEADESMQRSFDVVFFFGVYYHLRHPLLVLEKLAKMTNSLLILEGHCLYGGRRPMMRFFPEDELRGDSSNWWAGNEPCLLGMLRAAGFTQVECVDKYPDFRGGGRILITARK